MKVTPALDNHYRTYTPFGVSLLNARQTKFVAEYLKDHVGAQAAIRAGYSAKAAKEHASRLLTNVNIQEAIAKRTDKLAAADEMDARWVRERVKAIIEDNKVELPMVALKGLELASRYNGMFQDGVSAAGIGLQIVLHLGGEA